MMVSAEAGQSVRGQLPVVPGILMYNKARATIPPRTGQRAVGISWRRCRRIVVGFRVGPERYTRYLISSSDAVDAGHDARN